MSVSSRRYLSLWLRRLATDRIARRSSLPDDAALVVAEPVKSALRLSALSDAAAARGLTAGMPLADARAMFPDLVVEQADPHADRLLLEAVADWCDRYTPLVALAPPDGILLDVTGCLHLFGGEAELVGDIVARLRRQGLQARAAIAGTVGAACAFSHHGAAASTSAQTHEALSALPLAALRLAPEVVVGLAQAGLTTIADVIARPRAPLAARFGPALIRRIDQLLGREDEPITPRLPVPALVVEQRFADPVALEADMLGTIEKLAQRLDILLERRGEGLRRAQVALFRTDGKVFRIEVGTAMPLRDPARLRRLFAERLSSLADECDPGFGFDMMRLSALVCERSESFQGCLDREDEDGELAHLVDRLGARFGLRRICRLLPQDTHIPEWAALAIPAHAAANIPLSTQPARRQDSLAAVRPLRLFERPEPIETVAEVPDGPPGRFRWRNVWHDVTRAEGPERIAMEWWRDVSGRTLTRDYFRVESSNGDRVWLYREGLYESAGLPRWFLHGLFG